jgi:hypothetical protein
VRVVPVANGFGLVQVTSRMTGTHLLHDGPSSSVANTCSALTAISRSPTARAFAVCTNSSSTGNAHRSSHGWILSVQHAFANNPLLTQGRHRFDGKS